MAQKTIGRYEIRGELGRGGMGAVYLAHDPTLNREVALKLLPSYFAQEPEFSSRFAREARTLAGLDHHAIVPVHDYGEDDIWPYFVMRYMRGGSLKDRLANGSLDLAQAGHIVQRIAGALDKAHSQGVVHRDLKPGNILFDSEGQSYLSDFGIVRLAERSENFTRTGNTLGTPAYMSPEQVKAAADIDGRSDVYSLGIVLFEMLAGEPPYDDDSAFEVQTMHVSAPIPNLLERRSDLPAGIQQVIDKAMAKDRDDRYQTAGDMAVALQDFVEGPTPSRPVTRPSEPQPAILAEALSPAATGAAPSRKWILIGIVAAAVICFAAIAVTSGSGLLSRWLSADGVQVAQEEVTPAEVPIEAPIEESTEESSELSVGEEAASTVVDLGEPGPLAAIPPNERADHYTEPPEMVIDPDKEYEAVIRTEKGDMRLRLFAAESPQTVNNFVFLARQGFYDGTTFHRVIADFMAQGGDPTGSGSGGPGYTFADEVDSGLVFDRPGLLAMGNRGPNTNGSQFFITYVSTPHLDGLHTIFGELIAGDDVLDSLTLVLPGTSTTAQGDVIERIAIIER